MVHSDILATAVCSPVDAVTGLADRTMWFPEGSDWYDMSTGNLYKGDTTDTLRYTIGEIPWFVHTGAIIPLASEKIGGLQEHNNEIWLSVAPGDGFSATTVYEDDGCTQAYMTEWATTKVEKKSSKGLFEMTVHARKGSYRDMDRKRTLRVRLESVPAPSCVKVEYSPEVKLAYARYVDICLQLPMPFLNFSQCGSFITEDPFNAVRYFNAMDPDALKAELDSRPKFSPEFKRKVLAQAGCGN